MLSEIAPIDSKFQKKFFLDIKNCVGGGSPESDDGGATPLDDEMEVEDQPVISKPGALPIVVVGRGVNKDNEDSDSSSSDSGLRFRPITYTSYRYRGGWL